MIGNRQRRIHGSTLYCLEKANDRRPVKTNPSRPIGGGFEMWQPQTRESRERLLRIKPSQSGVRARRVRIGPLKRFMPRIGFSLTDILRGNPRM